MARRQAERPTKIVLQMKRNGIVLSLSGGMDSSTLLLRSLEEYEHVTALSFLYGQKHSVELEKADSLVKFLRKKGFEIEYHVIDLSSLSTLLSSSLVSGGDDVPEGFYAEENMKSTVVPNRNKIFASIIQAVALSKVQKTGKECDIALGIHAGDHTIYPDTRPEFRDADDKAFRLGNWDTDKIQYFTPYLMEDKYGILKDGERLCEKFSLSFDSVYLRTFTSYKPVQVGFELYSDFKSASSVERILAFVKLGRRDPIPYANEEGKFVDWEEVSEYALSVERAFEEGQNPDKKS